MNRRRPSSTRTPRRRNRHRLEFVDLALAPLDALYNKWGLLIRAGRIASSLDLRSTQWSLTGERKTYGGG
jgi:hypothetical protein